MKPGSLPHRVVEFFRANPEEELTIDDIAIKFGLAGSREVVPRLTRPVQSGHLRVLRTERPEWASRSVNVYGAGPQLQAKGSD
jgi:hypothetical protein